MADKRAYSVKETAQELGCSVDLIYDMVREGEIKALRFGRKIIIPAASLERLLAGVGAEQKESA